MPGNRAGLRGVEREHRGRLRPLWRWTVTAVVVTLAALAGLIAGSALTAGRATPEEGSVDAGFARDMSAHHSQAVQMSVLVREGTEDPEIRSLALDILLTQQQQAGQMFGWLELWGLPHASQEPVMGWMQHHAYSEAQAHGDGSVMPGMATTEQLNRLSQASGLEAERLYLQLMIPHHQGGVEMAEYAADNAQEEAVRDLAQRMVEAQKAELSVLNNLLET